MLLIIFIVLLVLVFVGIPLHFAGGLTGLLVILAIIALIVYIYNHIRGTRL